MTFRALALRQILRQLRRANTRKISFVTSSNCLIRSFRASLTPLPSPLDAALQCLWSLLLYHSSLGVSLWPFVVPLSGIPYRLNLITNQMQEHTSVKLFNQSHLSIQRLFMCLTQSCDMWSLGVVIYIMLCGYPPFYSEVPRKQLSQGMRRRIMAGDYDYPDKEWSKISAEAKEVIARYSVVSFFFITWATVSGFQPQQPTLLWLRHHQIGSMQRSVQSNDERLTKG